MGRRIRISGGQFGGRNLQAPKHSLTRPTASRAREALFNILGESVVGKTVADCFAGSGALGLEALSRGASSVTLFESNREAIECIRQNIESLGVASQATLIGGRLPKSLPKSASFDLIFMDPPWDKGWGPKLLEAFNRGGVARAGAMTLLEERRGNIRASDLHDLSWDLVDQRTYGDTELSFLVYRSDEFDQP